MSYRNRMLILLALDIAIIWVAIVVSYMFRFNGDIPPAYEWKMYIFALVSTVVSGFCLFFYRMYKRSWQHASIGEIVELCKAILIGTGLSYLATWLLCGERVPLSIATRTLEIMLLLMGGSRFVWRLIRVNRYKKSEDATNMLVVGAGDCGALIAKEIMTGERFKGSRLIGFIDDDPYKLNMRVAGHPVMGDRSCIASIVKKYDIHDIVIAMPSARRSEVKDVIHICKLTGAKVKIIPAINDLITGELAVEKLRSVEVEDLLGRDPVRIDMQGVLDYVSHKVVLVTGAGGSIGSELCRQIASFQPEKLLLLGHGENSIYTIEMELREKFPDTCLETVIADIQDRERMAEVFQRFRPQVVFHAAAHKHVPLMERNPSEAVKNNVFGTRNVADCANQYGAERFVMISSDKAVNPTSVMGATKRIAEMYIQSINESSTTQFVAVRFGNVLGSRGSVIPRFRQQIAAGGPVTVTHPDMVRYFMTIPEAVQLVIQAGSFAQGGEIFILDMGKPVRIKDLAQDLIRLSGYEPDVDIEIKYTGMREGEKLFEELLTEVEATTATQHERIYVGQPIEISQSDLDMQFRRLEKVLGEDQASVRGVIERIVPFYSQVS